MNQYFVCKGCVIVLDASVTSMDWLLEKSIVKISTMIDMIFANQLSVKFML